MNTITTIKTLLEDLTGIDATLMSEGTRLVEDLGLDSLDLVYVLKELEREFVIEIEDKDFAECRSIQNLVELVTKLKND